MELTFESKRAIFSVSLGVVFLILLGRFAYVQLYHGEQYREVSERNRVRVIDIEPPRGVIRDRYGEILVDNRPAYAVYAIPAEVESGAGALGILATAFHTTEKEVKTQIDRNKRGNYAPVKIGRQIDFAGFSLLHERRLELPGVDFRPESRRAYLSGVKAPHLFGYLSEISDAELTTNGNKYSPGDLIGKKGIERQYESILRGAKGRRFVEVDALGRPVRDLTEADSPLLRNLNPVPGTDLVLGIDASLQRMLESELAGRNGGAVVLNCKNGEVLALVSKPDFDPDVFSKPMTREVWTQMINDPNRPLYDRMVQSLFPPGSTFKLVLALAGLQSGLINPEERVFCPGYYRLGTRSFECHRKGGHGTVNLLAAIEQSCNVYFYRMGLKVGLANWSHYAKLFGFGKATGIDLIGESSGLVPDQEYFDQRYGAGKWSKGQILNLAIGQGDLLVTPLQMAYLAMVLANEGHMFRPRLKRGTIISSTPQEQFDEPDSMTITGVDAKNFALVKQGMYRVVNGGAGTARSSKVQGITSAGKTGTAQNPHGESHAWFIGFTPYEDPQIAYCVFIQNGGAGSAVAAPIAKKIVALLLEQNKLIPYAPAPTTLAD